MDTELFIKNILVQFEGANANNITMQSSFEEIGNWDSLTALSIINMVDAEYGVSIEGDDIVKSPTIGDLYNIVNSRYFRVLP